MNRKGSLPGRQNLVAAIFLLLAACSTADYSKPVGDFAAAAKNAETALSQLNAQVTESYTQTLQQRIVERRAEVRFVMSGDDEDCLVESSRCRLILFDDHDNAILDGRGNPQQYPPEPPLATMTLVMADISRYAGNLKALLEADTAQQVAGQVNAALGSVEKLANTVAKATTPEGAPPPSVPSFATPAGAAVNWVVGKYVEHVKYQGLQRATAAAKPVVQQAADLFSTTADVVALVPKSLMAEEVSAANDTFRGAINTANLAKLTASAATYDSLLKAPPADVFQSMGKAHDALAESLQNGEQTLASAIAHIEAFTAEAEELVKILEDLRAIVPHDQEG